MPETPQLVVVNTTPIVALSLIGKLNLLRHLYGEVMIPLAVEAEVQVGGPDGTGKEDLAEAKWLRKFR